MWRSDVAIVNRSAQSANLTPEDLRTVGTQDDEHDVGGNAQRSCADRAGQTRDHGRLRALEVDSDQDISSLAEYNQVDATHTYGRLRWASSRPTCWRGQSACCRSYGERALRNQHRITNNRHGTANAP